MNILVVDDYQALSRLAAQKIAEAIYNVEAPTLGLATGGTPIGLYKELVSLYRARKIDFSNVTTFNLDEYVGLAPDHPESYHKFMYDTLFNHINIKPENINILKGDNPDLIKECADFESRIAGARGIDVQVLGIGTNGHIGFNEPGSTPEEATRVVKLSNSTLKANSRFFGEQSLVPRLALTMGLQTILQSSRQIILLASGSEKAEAVYKMIYDQVSPSLPASYLQKHKNVVVIADKEAAKKMEAAHCIFV